jgi:hypothetical protein
MTPQEHAEKATFVSTLPVCTVPPAMGDAISSVGRDGSGGEMYRATTLHISEPLKQVWLTPASVLACAVREVWR